MSAAVGCWVSLNFNFSALCRSVCRENATRHQRVVGNPDYGPCSDLYGAMEYVRKSQRKSGLTQKSNAPLAPPRPVTLCPSGAAQKRTLLESSARFSFLDFRVSVLVGFS